MCVPVIVRSYRRTVFDDKAVVRDLPSSLQRAIAVFTARKVVDTVPLLTTIKATPVQPLHTRADGLRHQTVAFLLRSCVCVCAGAQGFISTVATALQQVCDIALACLLPCCCCAKCVCVQSAVLEGESVIVEGELPGPVYFVANGRTLPHLHSD